MNVLFYIIFMSIISKINTESKNSSAKTNVEEVGCIYHGKLLGVNCDKENLPIEKIPPQCSFLVWQRVVVNWRYNIKNFITTEDEDIINTLTDTGRKVYLSYGYSTSNHWVVVLAGCDDGMNIQDEIKYLKQYLDKYKNVKGLILERLEPRFDYKGIPSLSENLKTYIDAVKTTFGLEIALGFAGNLFIDYYNDPKAMWLNFDVIDSSVSFYVMILTFFNTLCTKELRNIGLVPFNGKAEYTIEKLMVAIEKAKIPKDKIFYVIDPLPAEEDSQNNDVCFVNYGKMCADPVKSIDWCADTTTTLYEKGKFVREQNGGIIVGAVDLDDWHGVCKCDTQLPGFNAILNGFKCNPAPPPCKLYDRC